jgi:hypothetical protein
MKTHRIFDSIQTVSSQGWSGTISYKDWLNLPYGLNDKTVNMPRDKSKAEKKWICLAKNIALTDYVSSVDVALIEGRYYKLTGITRMSLWESNVLKAPDKILVVIYRLDKIAYEELINILLPLPLKNISQKSVLDCYKRLGLSFNSDRIKHGYIGDAINITLRGEPRALQDKRSLKQEVNIDRAIELFQKELMAIDEINPDLTLFSTGIVAAALIMISIDKNNIGFFIALNKFHGKTKNGRYDPVESLLRIIDALKRKSASKGKIQVEICSKTIRAIHAWNWGENNDKYWLKRLASVDFTPFIRTMKTIKKIHGIREL